MRLNFTQMQGTYLYRTVFGVLAPGKKKEGCKALTRAVANAMIRACPMRNLDHAGYILRRSLNDGAIDDFFLFEPTCLAEAESLGRGHVLNSPTSLGHSS